jgi:hypothetical protein
LTQTAPPLVEELISIEETPLEIIKEESSYESEEYSSESDDPSEDQNLPLDATIDEAIAIDLKITPIAKPIKQLDVFRSKLEKDKISNL